MGIELSLPERAPAWLLPGQLSYEQATDDVWDFMVPRHLDWDDAWSALEILGALIMQRRYRDHPPLSRHGHRLMRFLLALPGLLLAPLGFLLALLALLILLASPEPSRPDEDAVLHLPSAPLVRAHTILTAAPPASRAPVLAGAPSLT
jgi:hypothetical protein